MIQDIVDNKACFGCTACMHVCPKSAITFSHDAEGFSVPSVDSSLCVNCGACRNVCQSVNAITLNKIDDAKPYIAHNKDRKSTKRSASGGAFVGIATYVIERLHGVVYGASMTETNLVKHIKVDKVKNLYLLQKSKYVQSDLGSVYKEISSLTRQKKYVLFSGTPCQVAGLYKYNKCDSTYLLTIDIICHGVPSPKLFSYCVEGMSKEYGDISKIEFRYKSPFFASGSSFVFKAKSTKRSILQLPSQNAYFNIFLKGLAFRESCYRCPYAQTNRIGDFTIGDCDSRSAYPSFHSTESSSTLIVNTHKASNLWNDGLSEMFDYNNLDICLEATKNRQLKAPFERPPARDVLYSEINVIDYYSFSQKYSEPQTIFQRYKLFLSYCIPPIIFKIKAFINKHI